MKYALPFILILALFISGCALGAGTAATAGYSLKAKTADELTPKGEERIVNRAKREIKDWLLGIGVIKKKEREYEANE